MEKYEDRSMCSKCGGYCCQKSGCDYFVSDLKNTKLEYIESLLDTGRVSIVAGFNFKRLPKGQLICEPFLYLRARNINRGEIDLLSFKTTCASLESEGCHYDISERPSGGSCLIPKFVNGEKECFSEVDRVEELLKWTQYQKVLERIVKRRTGMSVYAKLKCDAENLFYDLAMGNITGVKEEEIRDVIGMVPMLAEIYKEEFRRAEERCKKDKTVLSLKR